MLPTISRVRLSQELHGRVMQALLAVYHTAQIGHALSCVMARLDAP
jgi:hypothetical protein